MIHPNMATMLSTIVTDAAISQPLLQQALVAAVNVSFNRISIDGDTSTNDTVLLLANGLAGHQEIADIDDPNYCSVPVSPLRYLYRPGAGCRERRRRCYQVRYHSGERSRQ